LEGNEDFIPYHFIFLLFMKVYGFVGSWKVDPAGLRETEFIGVMLAAGFRIANPAARIRINKIAHQERKSTGSTSVAPDLPWVWRVESRWQGPSGHG
jgi:hypothetical protein